MPHPAPPAFSIQDVVAERSGHPVLQRVTIELPAGRVTALVGRSGSGKTSLLRLLNRLDDVSAGSIRLNGRDLSAVPVRELRRRVGFVFQSPSLFPGTVKDNLGAALEAAEVDVPDLAVRIREAMRDAELPEAFLTREARELSGGEGQRVTLARALVLRPEILLLDEPTSALDPDTADRIVATVREMSARRGITVVVSTHRMEEAQRMADFVVLLEAGKVARAGTPEEVLDPGSGRRGS